MPKKKTFRRFGNKTSNPLPGFHGLFRLPTRPRKGKKIIRPIQQDRRKSIR